MKDYARTHRSFKDKLTFKLKNLFKFLFLFTKISAIFLIVAAVVLLFVWFVIPGSIVGADNQNFMFTFSDNCSKNINKYYVFFDGRSSKLTPFVLEGEYPVQIIKKNNLQQLSDISLTDYLSLTEGETTQKISSAWLVGTFIQHGFEIEQDCESQLEIEDEAVLSQLAAGAFLKDIEQNPSQIKQNLRHWFLFKTISWEPLNVLKPKDASSNIFASDCSAAVLNATGVGGYAQAFSSVLESSGIRVVRVDSYIESQDKSKIYVSNKEDCYAVADSISRQLLGNIQDLHRSPKLTQRYRADVVIVLGEKEMPILVEDSLDIQELDIQESAQNKEL